MVVLSLCSLFDDLEKKKEEEEEEEEKKKEEAGFTAGNGWMDGWMDGVYFRSTDYNINSN